jgi:hypothetical protein
MPIPDKPFLSRAAATTYLRERWGIERSASTLAKLASRGTGPAVVKAGRTPLYAEAALDTWASALLREPPARGRAA